MGSIVFAAAGAVAVAAIIIGLGYAVGFCWHLSRKLVGKPYDKEYFGL